jgi:hypothetical protein
MLAAELSIDCPISQDSDNPAAKGNVRENYPKPSSFSVGEGGYRCYLNLADFLDLD